MLVIGRRVEREPLVVAGARLIRIVGRELRVVLGRGKILVGHRQARSSRKRTASVSSAFVGWKRRPSRVGTTGVYGIEVAAPSASAVTSAAMRDQARQSGSQPMSVASRSPPPARLGYGAAGPA